MARTLLMRRLLEPKDPPNQPPVADVEMDSDIDRAILEGTLSHNDALGELKRCAARYETLVPVTSTVGGKIRDVFKEAIGERNTLPPWAEGMEAMEWRRKKMNDSLKGTLIEVERLMRANGHNAVTATMSEEAAPDASEQTIKDEASSMASPAIVSASDSDISKRKRKRSWKRSQLAREYVVEDSEEEHSQLEAEPKNTKKKGREIKASETSSRGPMKTQRGGACRGRGSTRTLVEPNRITNALDAAKGVKKPKHKTLVVKLKVPSLYPHRRATHKARQSIGDQDETQILLPKRPKSKMNVNYSMGYNTIKPRDTTPHNPDPDSDPATPSTTRSIAPRVPLSAPDRAIRSLSPSSLFPSLPFFKNAKHAQDFHSGLEIAIENIQEDHAANPKMTLLEVLKNLENERPTFQNDVYDYRAMMMKGNAWVVEAVRKAHEMKPGLATKEICRLLEKFCQD